MDAARDPRAARPRTTRAYVRACAWAAAAACVLVAGVAASMPAGAASSGTVVTANIPSATTMISGCTSASATAFGVVQPGTTATTATGAGACTVQFGSSNDTSMLRMQAADGTSPAMSNVNGGWNTGYNPTNEEVFAVAMYDVNVGLRAGANGLVGRTINAGSSWDDMHGLGAGLWAFDIDHAPGNNDQWIVGFSDRGLVSTTNARTSHPANPTWTDRSAALAAAGWPASVDVRGVAMSSASTWIVVGEDGWVARTTTTGTSFTAYQMPELLTLRDVDWVTANTFMAAGDGVSLYKTTTGGTNAAAWTVAYNTDGDSFRKLSVGDATHIYAIADTGTVVRWNGTAFVGSGTYPTTGAGHAHVESIATSTASSTTVFAAGGDGRVWRSLDSGATWGAPVELPRAIRIFDIDSTGLTGAIAVGSQHYTVSTTNATVWNDLEYDPTSRPYLDIDADPSNGRVAVAVGVGGAIRTTSDGGATWTARTSGTTANLFSVTHASSLLVWAVGSGGTIIKSVDGGTTWSTMTSGVTTTLRSVTAADESYLWASGYGGTILRSTNGGTSWVPQSSGSTVELFDVFALDRTTAWAVGGDDTLLRTTNGGSTWTNRTSAPAPDAGPTGVAALDASRVYASTTYGDVWTSADGGANWTQLTDQTVGRQRDIEVKGRFIGVVGDGQAMFSTDAGATWSTLGTPDYFTTGFSFVDAHTAYAGSDFGRIYDTDETAIAASQLPDYGGGNTFATAATTGMFGVCLQSLAGGASVAAPWAVDGGTCTASDADPWRAIPTTQTKVATQTAGALGTATFVWGVGMRSGQQAGTYTAGVAFETVAPAS